MSPAKNRNYENLSDKELIEYEKLMMERFAARCRETYLDYLEYVHFPHYKMGKHIVAMGQAAQELVERRRYLPDGRLVRILIFNTPPQHGKTMAITATLPSWYLGKFPEHRVIVASYNDDFAAQFGRSNREKIRVFGKEIFDLSLKQKPLTDKDFETVQGGGFKSRGYMSGITGNPAEFILIDDPIKNRLEADSETDRERKWNEYLNSIRTRLAADGVIILILTRWHEDDIAGRIIQRESLPVEVMRFPCEAEEGDLLGREVGEPLFPEIGKDKKWLEEFKPAYIQDPSDGGIRAWNALYQCRPSSLEGNIFQRMWWNYWVPDTWDPRENLVTVQLVDGTYINKVPEHIPTTFDQQIQSWDLSFKDGISVDNVAGGVWSSKGAKIYLNDAMYKPMGFVETVSSFKAMTAKWSRATAKLIEAKANGEAVYDMLQSKIHGIIMIEPHGNKNERAQACSYIVESGNVYLPHPKLYPWVTSYIDQLANFPNAANDDYVDMTSQALLRFMYVTDKKLEQEQSMAQKHRERKMRAAQHGRRNRRSK